MSKALKVLVLVAMVICLIEMFAVLVDLKPPLPPVASGPSLAQALACQEYVLLNTQYILRETL
jgi:hypothetical protein